MPTKPSLPKLRRRATRIKRMREDRGQSQTQVALHLGLTPSYWSTVEAGRRSPPVEVFARLADYWGVSLGELLSDREEERLAGALVRSLGRDRLRLLLAFDDQLPALVDNLIGR